MSYDPELRRDTPLALKLKAQIRQHGPMTTQDYMEACLHDGEHGYYRVQRAIGRDGDFITAPEISQIFGEIIGLWAAVVWQLMGSPERLNLIELGPGRGTLMADALRASRNVPGFHEAIATSLFLVERNEALRRVQQATLAQAPVRPRWVDGLEGDFCGAAGPTGSERHQTPTVLLANEFLDCLPQAQFVRTSEGWLVRGVTLDASERLVFCTGFQIGPGVAGQMPTSSLDVLYPTVRDGDIVEPGRHDWVDEWVAPWTRVAALVIDYGYAVSEVGDTLQAVRGHLHEHPLTSPGEADLTVHVDFASIVRRARRAGALAVDGPVAQGDFLGSLGVVERASRLMAANTAKAALVEAGVARLLAPQGMGTRFKVLGLRSSSLPPLPGLPAMDKARASA